MRYKTEAATERGHNKIYKISGRFVITIFSALITDDGVNTFAEGLPPGLRPPKDNGKGLHDYSPPIFSRTQL